VNLFAVLHRLDGAPVPNAARRELAGTSCCQDKDTLQWLDLDGTTILIGSDPAVGPRPTVAQHGQWVGVGMVRLDHPADVAATAGLTTGDGGALSHLSLVLRAFLRIGAPAVERCVGDFAFVLIDLKSGQTLAARDPFGVRTLFHAARPDLVAFASRAELLATPGRYDIEFIAAFLSGARPGRQNTVYAGVHPVAPGSTVSIIDGHRSTHTFWDPSAFAGREVIGADPKDKVAAFRDLFSHAVRLRMAEHAHCWSELSGGLDSSSVVSMAQTLARTGAVRAGLAGTITIADTAGAVGDERIYSDEVVRTHGVRNELILDYRMLQDDGAPVPDTDQPARRLLFYARDRAIYRCVRRAGGTVLLGGQASDQYLTGYMFFAADWLARGRIREALRETTRWSVLGEVSFWELAFKNLVMPFLPPWLNARLSQSAALPPWLNRSVIRRFALDRQQIVVRAYAGRVGHKYTAAVLRSVGDIPYGLDRGIISDHLDLRYPFLYRPLVEFALALPPEFCAVPTQAKWILRQAMAGLLPESVRTRRGKGAIDGRLSHSLAHERPRLERLLRAPILADLGCIDPSKLRAGVGAAIHGDALLRGAVIDALALELWLSARSGRQTAAVPEKRRREAAVGNPAS
jgi:asparagine synthase (glutamine-hydrolysing)